MKPEELDDNVVRYHSVDHNRGQLPQSNQNLYEKGRVSIPKLALTLEPHHQSERHDSSSACAVKKRGDTSLAIDGSHSATKMQHVKPPKLYDYCS